MQTVSEVMSRNAQVVAPGESLQRAAQLMGELDVGALPVCDGDRLVGMVTDRDIAVRGAAPGKSPQSCHVDEVMTADVRWCFEDQPVDEVMAQMSGSQVRRIPVVTHDEQHRLVGIVSLADLAHRGADSSKAGAVLAQVSSTTGTAPGATTGKTASGVPEALAGIDQRPQGGPSQASAERVSGQPRLDSSGEPLHGAGRIDPASARSAGQDDQDKAPPSESNAV